MPTSNRWIATLTVISAALIVADAAPLPQNGDMNGMSQEYDVASTPDSFSSSYGAGPSSYSYDGAPLYIDDEDQTSYPAIETTWNSDAQLGDPISFSISNFSSGSSNIEVLAVSPSSPSDFSSQSLSNSMTDGEDASINSLRLTYPARSLNRRKTHRGGSTFYARPINMGRVNNATLEYSVFFPRNFDFAKAGKLPGLYGGHSGCASGVDARDCFSTRMKWRGNDHGELYHYAPRHRQTQRLCRSQPFSFCSTPYGLSFGRGSWSFARGAWTHIRQDVWLNTPGNNDGGFNVWINGKLVAHADDVFYRDVTKTCLAPMGNSATLSSGMSSMKRDDPEDDQPSEDEPSDDEPSGDEPSDDKPSDDEPSDDKPADPEPADDKPPDEEPSEPKPADPKPADPKPVDPKPADPKPISDEPSKSADPCITENWFFVIADTDYHGLIFRSKTEPVKGSILKTVKRWLELALSKRAPYDDGHWRGINGYPGDPGYNGGLTTALPTATITKTQTATITKTETATVTVTATPVKKPAPPKPKVPAKPKPPAKAKPAPPKAKKP